MTFAYNAFSENDIVNAVNEALSRVNSKVKASSLLRINENVAQLRTTRGATLVAILGSFSPSMLFVRGVHRIRRRFQPFTYLFNGQGEKNLDTLAFCGENGTVFYADMETYRAWIKGELSHLSDAVIDDRVKRESEHNPKIKEALSE